MTPTDNRDLDALFAAATADAFPEERNEEILTVVLAAFNAAGMAECERAGDAAAGECRTRARRGRTPVIVRCAAMLFVAAGGGVVAASAGILPASAQSLAHQFLGGIGVPAPNSNGTSQGGAAFSPIPTASSTSTSQVLSRARGVVTTPDGSATSSAMDSTLRSLCSEVIGNGNSWQGSLSDQDLALLTAAAGGDKKIVPYCAHLSAPAQQPSTTPPDDSGTVSSSPSDGTPGDKGSNGASSSANTSDGSPNPNSSGNGSGDNGGGSGGGNGTGSGSGGGSGSGSGSGSGGGGSSGHDGSVNLGDLSLSPTPSPSPGPTQ